MFISKSQTSMCKIIISPEFNLLQVEIYGQVGILIIIWLKNWETFIWRGFFFHGGNRKSVRKYDDEEVLCLVLYASDIVINIMHYIKMNIEIQKESK